MPGESDLDEAEKPHARHGLPSSRLDEIFPPRPRPASFREVARGSCEAPESGARRDAPKPSTHDESKAASMN